MAITTLIGTIVGAGILGIPYVIAKAGVLYGFFIILLIGIAFIFLNLFAGEIVLRTKGKHQLTGYAEKYLGAKGKVVMLIALFINIYGALTAYLIGEGATIHAVLGVGTPLLYTLIFFAVMVFIIYKGVKATGKAELILISLLFLVVLALGIFSFDQISLTNFTSFDPLHFFLPYGVILFAFMASPALPEMAQVLGNQKHRMKKAIIIGSVIPIFLYMIFSLIIVGLVGLPQFEALLPNERIATIALSIYSQPILGLFANLLAIITMLTSFLALGLALVDAYRYDYDFPHWAAILLTFSFPLIIVLFNLTTFISVLGVTGAIAGGLDAILIVLIYWKAKKLGERKPEYSLKTPKFVGMFLIALFVVGIIYQIFSTFF